MQHVQEPGELEGALAVLSACIARRPGLQLLRGLGVPLYDHGVERGEGPRHGGSQDRQGRRRALLVQLAVDQGLQDLGPES